jgi:hypothetical protein
MDHTRLLLLVNPFVIYFVLAFSLLFFQHFCSIDVYAQNDSTNEKNQITNKPANGNNHDSDIAPEQIAAAAAIAGAIITGLFTLINQRKIASLDIRKIKEDARTSYEYTSRKHLYEECEPILFQLVEMSDNALHRIMGLAREAREGRLKPNVGNMSDIDSYYLKTTIYRLIAPMAAFRLIQSQLTMVDLSLDPYISIQYEIAKAIYHTFSADYNIFDLAKKGDLEYEPQLKDKGYTEVQKLRLRQANPAKYKRQAIFVGVLEKLVDDLLIYDKQIKKNRIIRYGEFEQEYFSKGTSAWKDKHELVKIIRLLLNIHPKTHPILWRILITQSILYTALKNIRLHELPPYIRSFKFTTSDEIKNFDWRQKPDEATDDEVLNQPFKIAEEYLQTYEKNLYYRLINGI